MLISRSKKECIEVLKYIVQQQMCRWKKQNKVKRSKEENKKQSYNLTYIITASQQFKQK